MNEQIDLAEAAATLRRGAAAMKGIGFIHDAIAEGLVNDAKRLEAGQITDDLPEALALARSYSESA